MTAELHEDPVQTVPGSHQGGDADSRFVAEHAYLHLEAVFEDGCHGADSLFHEKDVLDLLSGYLQVLPESQRDRPQFKTLDGFGAKVLEQGVREASFSHTFLSAQAS